MINEQNVKAYCSEDISLIENYDKAIISNEKWDCHHRLEIQDDKVMSIDDLKNTGLYFQRPALELIFLKHSEHISLHRTGKNHPLYRKHHSEEAKHKMSKSHLGLKHSEEAKHKISEATKGKHRSEETKQKISKVMKGENHPLFGKHHSEETRQRMRDAWIKRKNITNSKSNSYALFQSFDYSTNSD